METIKKEILRRLCYTDLVYERIRKKLSIQLTDPEIEQYIFESINETPAQNIEKTGKNYYIRNRKKEIRMTINSYTYRIITVDKI